MHKWMWTGSAMNSAAQPFLVVTNAVEGARSTGCVGTVSVNDFKLVVAAQARLSGSHMVANML